MNIGFISEYFPPFAPGGAEWSSFFLARDLVKMGHNVVVVTPNYGVLSEENMEGVKVIRFPFYGKLKGKQILLTSFFHTNPLWVVWGSYQIFKNSKKNKLDILHVQGKFSILPVFFANLFLNLPVVITARDYQIICNYGFCLYSNDKACSFYQYFREDFRFYLNEYVGKLSLQNIIQNILNATWGRINCKVMQFFASGMNIVVLSKKQREIFLANGFKKVWVINNSTEFLDKKTSFKKENKVLFAGRLTDGKGVNLLINLIPDFFKKYIKYKFIFAGEGYLKEKLLEEKKRFPNLNVLGNIKHDELTKLYKRVKVVIVPSLWQEPFGRIALESLAQMTPVVVSKRGGLIEIVKDKKWGYVVEPEISKLMVGLDNAIAKNKILIENIKKDYGSIKNKFGKNISKEYINLYRKIQ